MDSERVLAAHSDSAAVLASILDQTTPTFSEADTGYELLFRALDFTSEPPPHPGMPSSMIFITSLLADLTPEHAIKLQQEGIGPGRKFGCGLFIPQKGITSVKRED